METNQNVLISTTNLATKASVRSDSETLAGFGLEKLSTLNTYEACRVAYKADDSVTFGITLEGLVGLKTVCFLKTNLKQFATYRIAAYDKPGGSQVLDTEVLSVYAGSNTYGEDSWGDFTWGGYIPEVNFTDFSRNLVHVFSETVITSYLEITITSGEEAPKFFESFMLWIATGFQPSVNADYGAELSLIEDTEKKALRSGARSYGSPVRRRAISLELVSVHKDEVFRSIVGPILQASGESRLILVIMTPLDPELRMFHTVCGNLTNNQKAVHSFWNRLNIPLEIEESP